MDFNDFGLTVGRYLATLSTLTDQQITELRLDSLGRLIISGRFLEDEAHTSGDPGLQMLAVRNDAGGSLVNTNGDYAPLQVGADGRLLVDANLSSSAEYAEDTAATSGDIGNFVLAVRQDTLATSTSTDGDYAAFKTTALGELYVADPAARTSLVDIDSQINLLTNIEDTASSSGDTGIMALAVRHDALGSLVDTDGDYAALQLDSLGRLKTVATNDAVGTQHYTVTDALAIAGDGVVTVTALATPYITAATYTHTTGTAYVYGWDFSCDQNAEARLVTVDAGGTIVYKVALNSSSVPTYSGYWSESARIEIPGAAGRTIQIQIKKRSATGSDALGSASAHIRTI